MRLWRTTIGILRAISGRGKDVEIHLQVGNTCWFPQPRFPSPSNICYPLGGEEGGTGQSSFSLRWARVICQPPAYANCLSMLYSKWHYGVNNSSNFHNKELPIKAMDDTLLQILLVKRYILSGMPGAVWDAMGALTSTSSWGHTVWRCPAIDIVPPSQLLREKLGGGCKYWREGWISVWANKIKSVSSRGRKN